MNKLETCSCNQCGKKMKIKIRQEVIDHEEDGADIVEKFMTCPACNKRYTIIILDNFIRERMAAREHCLNPKIDSILKNEMQKHLKELKSRYSRE